MQHKLIREQLENLRTLALAGNVSKAIASRSIIESLSHQPLEVLVGIAFHLLPSVKLSKLDNFALLCTTLAIKQNFSPERDAATLKKLLVEQAVRLQKSIAGLKQELSQPAAANLDNKLLDVVSLVYPD